MLERERDETHIFRQVDMCKWQMDDPEARVKSWLSDCTWLEDLSMDLSSRHLRTYEAKRSEEHLHYYVLLLFYFLLIFLSLFFHFYSSYFFLLFSFSLYIIFSFFIFSFAHQNFCSIILT
jgi:polyferredoxin